MPHAGQRAVQTGIIPLRMRGLNVIGLQWVEDTEADEQGTCIHRRAVIGTGRPYGTEAWVMWMVAEWSIQAMVRSPERPRTPAAN